MLHKYRTQSGLILTLLLISLPSSFARIAKYLPISRSCGAGAPSTELLATHKALYQSESLENDLWNSSSVQHRHAAHIARRQTLKPLYTIDTFMHVVADNSSAQSTSPNYITDAMIQNQFRYLANAYTNASIGYRLAGVTRVTNDTWASNGDDLVMKAALRRGTYSALNIYYQSLLQAGANTPGVPTGSTLLGFCSLPAAGVMASTTPDQYVVDGCNVLSGTMPGGNMAGYNLGGTTAHEVGHWNGLLHTFSGNSCSASDWGDYVADTPQEMSSTSEYSCPYKRDVEEGLDRRSAIRGR